MGERELFDVAVVGAGPAGIAAAVSAAEAGAKVVLIDESPRPGGQIWRHLEGQAPREAARWLERLQASGARAVMGAAVVDVVRAARFELTLEVTGGTPMDSAGARAAGAGDAFPARRATGGGAVGPAIAAARSAVGMLTIEASALVLATGARERFLPFPGWTLPNVMGIGGAQALLKAGARFAGKRIVVAGSGPLLLPASAALAAAGEHVLLVAEQAPRAVVARFGAGLWREPAKLAQAGVYRWAARRGPYRTGSWVTRADGEGRIEEVTVTDGRRLRTLPCDLLCTGFGLVPNVEMATMLGCQLAGTGVRVDDLQRTSVEGIWCAGEVAGVAGVEAALAEGLIAGCAAAGRPGLGTPHRRARDRGRRFALRLEAAFALRDELRRLPEPDTILCRCEDVPCGRIEQGWTARQARLQARVGMGACQGRVCGPAAEFLFGWDITGGRMPISPATIDTLARSGDS